MRKGFTLVEMAVVLIIIGIVIGMAIKGLSVLEAAKIRAEVSRINKIEAALKSFEVANNNLPALVGGKYSVNDLTNAQLLVPTDFVSRSASNDLTLVPCAPVTNGYATTGANVCISYTNFMRSLGCNLELFIDDSDTRSGLGRFQAVSTSNAYSAAEYADCQKLQGTSGPAYFYQVY